MSSHHVVKENQEPALLFWDIQSIAYHSFADLLEWNPQLIAFEKDTMVLEGWQLVADTILTRDTLLDNSHGLVPIDPDNHMLEILQFLAKKKFSHVNILSSKPLHTMHLIEQIHCNIGSNILSENSIFYQISPGFSKWFSAGTFKIHQQDQPITTCILEEDTLWHYKGKQKAWLEESK